MNCPECGKELKQKFEYTKHVSGAYYVISKKKWQCKKCQVTVLE
jgi:uncharacterized C2H2 Zn-finger protein